MFERMLDKQNEPTFEELIAFSGATGKLWLSFDEYMLVEHGVTKLIRFPYGKKYGWSVKYSVKSKHICDVFAESGAFTALFQVSNKAVDTVFDGLSDCAKGIWAEKSPCASGGWIEFRVLDEEHLENLQKIVNAKIVVR